MESIGIDLGSRKSHYCIRSASNEVCSEGSVKTAEIGVWLMSQAHGRITLETCTEVFAVADLANNAGHEVSVVPAAIVRQLGVGCRGMKNDRRDAQVLSRATVALGKELPMSTFHRSVRELRSVFSEDEMQSFAHERSWLMWSKHN